MCTIVQYFIVSRDPWVYITTGNWFSRFCTAHDRELPYTRLQKLLRNSTYLTVRCVVGTAVRGPAAARQNAGDVIDQLQLVQASSHCSSVRQSVRQSNQYLSCTASLSLSLSLSLFPFRLSSTHHATRATVASAAVFSTIWASFRDPLREKKDIQRGTALRPTSMPIFRRMMLTFRGGSKKRGRGHGYSVKGLALHCPPSHQMKLLVTVIGHLGWKFTDYMLVLCPKLYICTYNRHFFSGDQPTLETPAPIVLPKVEMVGPPWQHWC